MKKFVLIFVVFLAFLFSLFYFELPLNLLRPVFHSDIIDQYAKQYDLDPLFVTALIKVESNFIRRARSDRGAVGLMQLLPSTARELADELGYRNFKIADLEDPKINIHLGTYYLSKLKKEFNGNETLVLAAYNAGKNKVQLWYRQDPLMGLEGGDIPYLETRNYVKEVMRTYQWLSRAHVLIDRLRGKKQ